MKKIFKGISLALVLALTCCICIFAAACNDEPDTDPNAYTITVLMPDGSALDGTKAEFERTWIQICLPDGSCSLYEGTLDKNGKCSFTKEDVKLEGDTYVIHVNKLPEGYTADTATVSPTSRTATIKLKNA